MPKIYTAGTAVSASDFNAVIKVAGLYGASAAGTDTYAITCSPVPGSLVAGDVFRFKADVGNTGAATLNVNGLGAIAIKKNVSEPLATGDILAGQFVEVSYDGTNFQIARSPVGTRVVTDITPVSNGSPSQNVYTLVTFPAELYDSNDEYASNVFTAKADGYYLVNVEASATQGASNTPSALVEVRVNSTAQLAVSETVASGTAFAEISFHRVIFLALGDTVSAYGKINWTGGQTSRDITGIHLDITRVA